MNPDGGAMESALHCAASPGEHLGRSCSVQAEL